MRTPMVVVVAASLPIFATTTVACSASSERGAPSAPSGADGGIVDGGASPPPSPSDAGLDGDGGAGVDGGAPDGGGSVITGAACDDGNPCTRDRSDGPEGCRHEPVPDETFCQDGDLCTLGDRCRGGRCVAGRTVSGPLAMHGSVRGAGSFHGAVLAVDDDRFVLFDSPDFGATLTVLGVDPSGLSVLHRRKEPLLVFSVREQLPRVALGNGRFAFEEDRYLERDLVIAEVDDADGVSILGRLDLSGFGALGGMGGDRSGLWACVNDPFGTAGILSVSLSDPGTPAVSGVIDLGERSCGSVAHVASAGAVYVNTTSGVRWLDTAADPPTVHDAFHGRGAPFVAGDDLLVIVSENGLTAYDPSSRTRRGDRSGRFEGAGRGPGPGTFWAIGNRPRGAGLERFLGLFEVDPAGGPIRLVEERLLARYPFAGDTPVEPLPSGGATVVDPATKRVFTMTDDGIDERRHPLLGSFLQVAGEGSLVSVRSVHSAHLLDVSKPLDPWVVAGGAHGALPAIALEDRPGGPWLLSGAARLFSVEDLSPVGVSAIYPGQVPIVRRRFDDSLRASDGESLSLPGGPARLLVTDGRIYRLAPDDAGLGARLERYRLSDRGAPLAIERTGSWSLSVDPDLRVAPNPVTLALAVDPRSRRAVAAVHGLAASGDRSAGALFWVDLDREGEAMPVPTEGAIRRVLVSGTRVVYVPRRGVVRFATASEPVVAELPMDRRLRDVVAFDGSVVYAGLQRTWGGNVSSGLVAIPWAATSESETTWIPLSSSPSTITAADEALVVGSYDALTTVHPSCSGR